MEELHTLPKHPEEPGCTSQTQPAIAIWQGMLLCHHTEQYLTLYTCLSISSRGKQTACLWSCKKSPSCYLWAICTWNSKAQLKGSAEISAHIMQCKSQHWECPHPPKKKKWQTSSSKKRPSLSLIAHLGSFANKGSAIQPWKQATYFGKKQALP